MKYRYNKDDNVWIVTGDLTKEDWIELRKDISSKLLMEEELFRTAFKNGETLTPKELSRLRDPVGKIIINGETYRMKDVNQYFKRFSNRGDKPINKVNPVQLEKTGSSPTKDRRKWKSRGLVDGQFTDGVVIRQARALNAQFDDQGVQIRESLWPIDPKTGRELSLDGFNEWLANSYKSAQVRAKFWGNRRGIDYDAGHGLAAEDWGPDSPSNLAPQPGLQPDLGMTKNRPHKGTQKSVRDLQEAGVNIIAGPNDWKSRYNLSAAFNEYLMKDSPNIHKMIGAYPEYYHMQALHGQGVNPGAMEVEGNRALANLAGESRWRAVNKVSSKVGLVDTAAQLGMGVATGNPLQAGVAGTSLAVQLGMQSPAAQQRFAKVVTGMLAQRAEKSALKLIPGVDIALSGAEAWGYLMEGKLNQAAIASLSGAIGWMGPPGDLAAALLDGANTAIDIQNLDFNQQPEYTYDEYGNKKVKKVKPNTNIRSTIGVAARSI